MDKYFKYSSHFNPIENQVVAKKSSLDLIETKAISEFSTPKEMSEFVTRKLVEFIERELDIVKGQTGIVHSSEVFQQH